MGKNKNSKIKKTKEIDKPVDIKKLFDLISKLRSEDGCPWDKKQTPETMAKHLVHEAYEAYEAIITRENNICEELGDTLFQLTFILLLFHDSELFSVYDVINNVHDKMIFRHPHIFSNKKAETIKDVKKIWAEAKNQEKKKESILAGIPSGIPALMKALLISKKAVSSGFEWESYNDLLDQFTEEVLEFKDANKNNTKEEAELEFGDILFTLVNIGRVLGFDAESALLKSSYKFEKRFKFMEKKVLSQGLSFPDIPREKLEYLWELAKKEEKTN